MFHVKHMPFVDMLWDMPKSCGIVFFEYTQDINNRVFMAFYILCNTMYDVDKIRRPFLRIIACRGGCNRRRLLPSKRGHRRGCCGCRS